MATCDAMHQGHKKQVVVYSQVSLLEHWRALVLVWRNLVVAGFQRNAQLVRLNLEVFHKGLNPIGDRTKVVVLELLILCRDIAH